MSSSVASSDRTVVSPLRPSDGIEESIYNTAFWLAYLANVLLVCANSLTFRFAEYVKFLGGTERQSGMIVSTGLIAAVAWRLWLGQSIDRHGARTVWLWSSGVFLLGGTSFLAAEVYFPSIVLARIAYTVGLAGMFTCSMVHIQNQVPPHRRTEIIGSLGSSGFLGTILGTQIGDLMFSSWITEAHRHHWMFGGCVMLGLTHAVVVWVLTHGEEHVRPAETPGALQLLVRFWPGNITLVGLAMGASFVITTVFLTRFATALSMRGIGTFFLAYSLTAFSCRWGLRDWGETVGRHKMVLYGLTALGCGLWSLIGVRSEWMFVLPAMLCGFGHAMLFPAVVSLGAGRFPVEYRGSGTTLVLGFTELGTIIAAPLLGASIDARAHLAGTTPGMQFYESFIAVGLTCVTVATIYYFTTARISDAEPVAKFDVYPAKNVVTDTVVAHNELVSVDESVPVKSVVASPVGGGAVVGGVAVGGGAIGGPHLMTTRADVSPRSDLAADAHPPFVATTLAPEAAASADAPHPPGGPFLRVEASAAECQPPAPNVAARPLDQIARSAERP